MGRVARRKGCSGRNTLPLCPLHAHQAIIATMNDQTARFPISRFSSVEAMKVEEYQYWRQRPAYERMEAVAEISAEAYALKKGATHAPRLQRTLVHLKR